MSGISRFLYCILEFCVGFCDLWVVFECLYCCVGLVCLRLLLLWLGAGVLI